MAKSKLARASTEMPAKPTLETHIYRPNSWPPPDDFPVSFHTNGKVCSRYADPIWDYTAEMGKTCILNFSSKPLRHGDPLVCQENTAILKHIIAWHTWGLRRTPAIASRVKTLNQLRQIFVFCTKKKILATDLSRYPKFIAELAKNIPAKVRSQTMAILHDINFHSEAIGFKILDQKALRTFAKNIELPPKRQTPYIPPRIWVYQVTRLRQFLDDFNEAQEQISDCYKYCVLAYEEADKLKKLHQLEGEYQPFNSHTERSSYPFPQHGSFTDVAKQYGIAGLLERWCGPFEGEKPYTITAFSRLLTLARRVSLAYIANFSLMRIAEAWSLPKQCLIVENDPDFGDIFMLSGSTTKTVTDEDARWITSPSIKVAIEALEFTESLRRTLQIYHHHNNLFGWELDLWHGKRKITNRDCLSSYPSYKSIICDFPQLFDLDVLKITDEDLRIAKLVNPDLNGAKFQVGAIWWLAWHQLRRTGAVNMQSSGLVSDPAMQYQLKHVARAMSLYYGQGYSLSALNSEAKAQYIQTLYEILAKELGSLTSDNFISPHGDSHKQRMLYSVSRHDANTLTKLAKSGQVSWRMTLLGGCTKRGPCEYGGVDNVARCAGGDGRAPCADALFDKRKLPQVVTLKHLINDRITDAKAESPEMESLLAQRTAIENAIECLQNTKQ